MTQTFKPAAATFIPTDLRDLDTPVDLPELVELNVILPQWQIDALEQEARGRGLTTGQMLRRVIGDFFIGRGRPLQVVAPA